MAEVVVVAEVPFFVDLVEAVLSTPLLDLANNGFTIELDERIIAVITTITAIDRIFLVIINYDCKNILLCNLTLSDYGFYN